MVLCKGCGGSILVKNGVILGKQRYKCKECGCNFREGDAREKHSLEKKMKVLRCYFEGVGIRSIARLEGVSSPLIIHWIRQVSKIVKEKLASVKISNSKSTVLPLPLRDGLGEGLKIRNYDYPSA